MQFKRIKILMLVLFVLLDIFLFNWWRAGQTTNEQVADANADILAEMKKQNIVLPTFSRSVQYNSYIAVQKAHKNEIGKLPSTLTWDKNGGNWDELIARFKPDDEIHRDDYEAITKQIKAVADDSGYHYNAILSAAQPDETKIYSQRINDLPVMNSAGTMTFRYGKDGKPDTVIKRQLTNIQDLRDDRATLTEEDAIVSLYRYNEIDRGDRLSTGYLGYDKTLSVNGYDIYLPVWVFEVKRQNRHAILKINAFTGDNLSE